VKYTVCIFLLVICLGHISYGQEYVVKSNDSLWKIAKKLYGDGNRWPEIHRANLGRISDPDHIRPGQKLYIPASCSSAPRGYVRYRTVRATVTAYEPSYRCCGRFADGRTSTGRNAWRTRGCAVAPRAIPYGTMIYIPGVGYLEADDTGQAMRRSWRKRVYHIDIRMKNYGSARRWGRQRLKVVLYKKAK